MTEPTVALCMIVRDEERHLQGCLDSVAELCAERVVVDTGSRDGTVAIAERAGARVVHFPWCDDFSAARNAGLAEVTSDWVLVLDADERLAEGAGSTIRDALRNAPGECGLLRLHDASRLDATLEEVVRGSARLAEPMHVQRLLRRTEALAYEGIVHESVRAWLVRTGGRSFYVDADIIHYGAVPSLRGAKQKSDRNARLLEKRLALEPDDFTIHGYLAYEYYGLGDEARARAVADEGWKLVRSASRSTLRSALRLMTLRCTLALRAGDLDETLATAEGAIAYEGESPDARFFLGRAHEYRALLAGSDRDGELRAAESAYRACLRWEHEPFAQRFVQGASGAVGRMRLGTVRLLQGEPAEALALFDAVLGSEPANDEALLGACEALVELDRPNDARARLTPRLDAATSPDFPLVAALAAAASHDQTALVRELGRVRTLERQTPLAPHRSALYAGLLCQWTALLGKPVLGPGAVGCACGILAGEKVSHVIGAHERRALVRFVRALITGDRVAFAERLLTAEAEAALPGIGDVVRDAVASLGMSVEERRGDDA